MLTLAPTLPPTPTINSLDAEDAIPPLCLVTPVSSPTLTIMTTLPPELIIKIISLAYHSLSNIFKPSNKENLYILSGRFQTIALPQLCRACATRSLMSVNKFWFSIVKELFWVKIEYLDLPVGAVNETRFWSLLEDGNMGKRVRNLDASLRGWSIRGGECKLVGSGGAEEVGLDRIALMALRLKK